MNLPDLVLSTDDSTLFKSAHNKESGEWEWSIVDKAAGDRSVHSDYIVGYSKGDPSGLCI